MGASGEDLIMQEVQEKSFHILIECKNQERLNLWRGIVNQK